MIDRYFDDRISSKIIVQCKIDYRENYITDISYDKKIMCIVSIIDRDRIIFIRVLYFTKLAKYSSRTLFFTVLLVSSFSR